MKATSFAGVSLLAVSLAVLTSCNSQRAEEPFRPKSGQAGKDVIWVPTTPALVDKMLDMADVTPQDFVVDLGSGDGRLVIAAAKRGARGLGIEYNPGMVELAREKAREAGVGDKTRFMQADLFETDFSQATVVTMFLLPRLNHKLRPKILELTPGTRIVSNSFGMGEWQPEETDEVSDDCGSYCKAYLWIVPAKVAGTWRFPHGELRVAQKFQMLSGSLSRDGRTVSIEDARLRGDRLSFRAGSAQYVGRVKGNAIEGVVMADGLPPRQWIAKRAG